MIVCGSEAFKEKAHDIQPVYFKLVLEDVVSPADTRFLAAFP